MKLRFGLLHLFDSPRDRTTRQYYSERIELVEYADAIGLDEVWLAEHHFSEYGVMPSTQVFGSYITARTKRIRIGTGVVVLPFHNPIRVAEEFAFLDMLSEGRLDFGVGGGYQPLEFAGYGIPMEERRTRFDESLDIIRAAWTQPSVTYRGKHFTLDNVRPRPRPYQTPHPPLFGSSLNPETIKYQAMKKLNLLFSPLSALPESITEYRSILAADGEDLDAYRIGGLVLTYVHEDQDQAYAEFEEPCMRYFRTFAGLIPAKQYPTSEVFYPHLHGALIGMLAAYDNGQLSFRQMVDEGPFRNAFLVGTPESVAAKLTALLSAYEGMTDVLCWTRLGGQDQRKVMHSIDLFVGKVAPSVKEMVAAPDSCQ
ncbi:MAG: LLM class flavin-dependent oxidoreductase [Candidatus Binatia bacterium]